MYNKMHTDFQYVCVRVVARGGGWGGWEGVCNFC